MNNKLMQTTYQKIKAPETSKYVWTHINIIAISTEQKEQKYLQYK